MSKGQKDKAVTAKEMMEQVGSTTEPSLATTEELYLNPNVGYADSDVAVQAVSDRAAELGVQRHKKNETRLIIEMWAAFLRAWRSPGSDAMCGSTSSMHSANGFGHKCFLLLVVHTNRARRHHDRSAFQSPPDRELCKTPVQLGGGWLFDYQSRY